MPGPVRAPRGAHSLPHRRPFVAAALLALLHCLLGVALVALAWVFLVRGDPAAGPWLLATAIALALAWLVALPVRRAARCPLCRGTPLLDTRAAPHPKASRVAPLNHGTTALLSLAFRHRFRCMFCGTPFDLLKRRPSRRQPGS